MLWHLSLLVISPFPVLESEDHVQRLLLVYGGVSILAAAWAIFVAYAECHVKVMLGIYTGLYVLLLMVRATDWMNVFYYGAHIDALFWENAFHAEGTDMLFTKPSLAMFLCIALFATGFHLLISAIARDYRERREAGLAVRGYVLRHGLMPMGLFVAALLVINLVIIGPLFSDKVRSPVYTQHLPEHQFVVSIQDYLKRDSAPPVELSDEQKRKLEQMGLRFDSLSEHYPLFKDSIFIGGPREMMHHDDPPNVILIMVESLSSWLLEDEEIRKLELTPHLDDFSKQALSYSNIVNANTPTLQGQVATLASSLHLYRPTLNRIKRAKHAEVAAQFGDQDDPLVTSYSFLPKLLKPHGYHSAHLQGGDPNFAHTERFFRVAAKYDDFICSADDEYASIRSHRIGHWGASDVDTFAVANQWLDQRSGPFFLTVSTIDIHHPYQPPLTKLGIDDGLLNSIHSTDVGFGVFWQEFQKSKHKNNTIVIVTADHPLFPSAEYLALRGGAANYYDRIPLMVYSPFHQDLMGQADSTLGSSLDIPPTLLEMLGIDARNAFLGLSLLSERKQHPRILGRVNLPSLYGQGEPEVWSEEDHEAFLGYLKYLSYKNRLHPAISLQDREAND